MRTVVLRLKYKFCDALDSQSLIDDLKCGPFYIVTSLERVYGSRVMPAYHVERSITIDADEARVRAAIEDFHEWQKWSPWLCMEPDAKIEYVGTPGKVDHSYSWDGELVGAGSIRMAKLEGKQIDLDLRFTRPFKSQADVRFEIIPKGDAQTEVVWHMDGKMPFFLFFMIGMMKVMIGMDYERGLSMLKEYVETGQVLSKIEILGVVDMPTMHYLGVGDECAIAEMEESMKRTLPAAHQLAVDHDIAMTGPPAAIYYTFDMKQQRCKYLAVVQTAEEANVAGGQTGTIEGGRALQIRHIGKYERLGNAWSTSMSYLRNKKLKPSKCQMGIEVYQNDPENTDAADLITDIFVPLRS